MKYYFFSWQNEDKLIFSGVTDRHPFQCLSLATKQLLSDEHYELVSWHEITEDEYNLFFNLNL